MLRRGDDHYRPIGWDEAYRLIAAELRALASPNEAVFYTSGRTSNEAGIPVLAAVSAPSSLAVDLASQSGLTLVAFLRGDSMNVYTRPDRIHRYVDPR